MRTLIRLAALGLAAATLTACGGSESSAYCDQLRDSKALFENFDSSSPDPAQLDQAFDRFRELAEEAPEAVAGDWETLETAIATVEDALAEAGIEMSDLAGMQNGDIPEGVDMAKLAELGPKLESLGDEKFTEAGDNIEKHAKDECDVDLSA